MWTRRILASLGIIGGSFGSVLTLLVAFGVDISPDQHTAIQGVVSLVLLALGVLVGNDTIVASREE